MALKILPQKSKKSKKSKNQNIQKSKNQKYKDKKIKNPKNPKLELKIYWGPKAPIRAHRALQAQRAPSPPQELKGRAHSALKLLGNFCVTLHFNTISSTKEILVTTFFYSRSSFLSYPLRQLYSVPFLRSVPELLHHPGSAYIF